MTTGDRSHEAIGRAAERLVQQAVDQGFPRYVEDDVILTRIAEILGPLPDREGRGT